MPGPTPLPVVIWYDGACPLCRAVRAGLARRDRTGALCFVDFRDPAQGPLPLSPAAHEAALVVREPGGAVTTGFAAVRAVLARLPRWRRLAPLLGSFPLDRLGSAAYRLAARHRRLLVPGGCECAAHSRGAGS